MYSATLILQHILVTYETELDMVEIELDIRYVQQDYQISTSLHYITQMQKEEKGLPCKYSFIKSIAVEAQVV